jgi:hypothetical protein
LQSPVKDLLLGVGHACWIADEAFVVASQLAYSAFFLTAVRWLHIDGMLNGALAIAGGMMGEPSAMAGWSKQAKH